MNKKDFRIIIAGSRSFDDYKLLKDKMNYYLQSKVDEGYNIIIISGTARGADKLGEKYAEEMGYKIERYPANWDLGKSAGYKRNVEMAKVADACVVFYNGTSPGTKHMINISNERKLPLRIVNI